MEVVNRKARYDYEILDTIEAGIVLRGTEVKSIREGRVNLTDSYANIKNGEMFLLNMHISPYSHGNIHNHDERRTRKLLLHKKEIKKLADKVADKGLTLVPLKLYFKKNKVKLSIGLVRGKKTYDKREAIKERDVMREIQRKYKLR